MSEDIDMRILDVFPFQNGVTVIVVEGLSDKLLSRPTPAFLTLDNEVIGSLTLDSERMTGRHPGCRAFETRDVINVGLLRSGQCYLRMG